MKPRPKTKKNKKDQSDYDSAWKDVIEKHLEAFLEFFFPEVYNGIDFSKGYEFLSRELRKIEPDANVGKRFADELVKVHLKDGTPGCIAIFIHIEVQGSKDENFEERLFVYFYRIYDLKIEEGTEVISLAVLTDEDENYRPDCFEMNRFGFQLRMKIPLVKTIDYKKRNELRLKIENSKNPMAMVVKAQLKSYEAKKAADKERFDIKRELIYQCYKAGYGREEISTLLRFLDYIIRLPKDLEKQIKTEIIKLEEETQMPYVTSWEIMAKEEGQAAGIKIGEKKGEKRGEKRGELREKIETAKRMLLDNVPMATVIKYTELTEKDLEGLADIISKSTH